MNATHILFTPAASITPPWRTDERHPEKAGLLRRLVTRGDLTVEDTDDGPRFTLTAQGQSEAANG